MGATIIEVDVADPANAVRAGALAEHGMCDVETDGHTVELRVKDGAHAAVAVVRTLDREASSLSPLAVRAHARRRVPDPHRSCRGGCTRR